MFSELFDHFSPTFLAMRIDFELKFLSAASVFRCQ